MNIRLSAIALVLSSVIFAGCTEELAPRDHFEAPFSLYGVLSPDLGRQSIWVFPLESFPTVGSPEPLDVDVTSTDLTTGETVVWQDSVVEDLNGVYEHIFSASFRAEHEHIYRIKAQRRSDGAVSFAEVHVPPEVSIDLLELDDGVLPLVVHGSRIRPLNVEIEYTLELAPHVWPFPLPWRPAVHHFTRAYQAKEVGGIWRVDVRAFHDRTELQNLYDLATGHRTSLVCGRITLLALNLHVLIGDTEWNPPDGEFDVNVLSQPGVLQNVENGFGFIGGGYRVTKDIYPLPETVEDACFHYPETNDYKQIIFSGVRFRPGGGLQDH